MATRRNQPAATALTVTQQFDQAVATATPRFNVVAAKITGGLISPLAAECEFARQALANSAEGKGGQRALMETFKANPRSLSDALVQLAACRLSLNPILKLAYLIPRGQRIYLEPSYKGLVHLAMESGQVQSVNAEVVHEGDDWTMPWNDEGGTHFRHIPCDGDRGKPIGAWAKIVPVGHSDVIVKFLTFDEIEKRKKAGGSGFAWKDWWSEMAVAKVLRHAFKFMPVTHQHPLMSALADEDIQVDAASPEPWPEAPVETAEPRNVTPPSGKLLAQVRDLIRDNELDEGECCLVVNRGSLEECDDQDLERIKARILDIEREPPPAAGQSDIPF